MALPTELLRSHGGRIRTGDICSLQGIRRDEKVVDWRRIATRSGKTSTEPPLLHPAGWQGPESNRLPVVSVVVAVFAGEGWFLLLVRTAGFRDKVGEDIPVLCQAELSGECLRSRIRTGGRWIPCSLPGIRGGEGEGNADKEGCDVKGLSALRDSNPRLPDVVTRAFSEGWEPRQGDG
jgi:hypothetical protein